MRIIYIKSNYVLNTKGFILNNYYLAILNEQGKFDIYSYKGCFLCSISSNVLVNCFKILST